MTLPRIEARHDLTPLEIDGLEDRLYAHNTARVGRYDGESLGFVARDEAGELVGAVAGYTWAGIAEARQVWVADAMRGQGLGRELMAAFIAEARRRGAGRVFLLTYDFQAPGFYEKLGFSQVAAVEGFPEGHTNYVYRLDL